MDSLASQIIIDIIKHEMGLGDDFVWLDDLNFNIPNDDNLRATVGMTDAAVMSSTSEIEFRDPDLYEINTVQLRENIQIDIMSRGVEALQRRWEVVAALSSLYSKQKQEENSFKIFKIANSFVNTSSAEGGSQLARYSLSFACFVWYKKERLLSPDNSEYYDTFDTRVDDAETIGTADGIIEFTIDETTEL